MGCSSAIGTCHICGEYTVIEKHHVFTNGLRKKSGVYGLVADLCHYCHNEPPNGVHFNAKNRIKLQQEFQLKAMEENNWTIDDFRHEFYKNYLD